MREREREQLRSAKAKPVYRVSPEKTRAARASRKLRFAQVKQMIEQGSRMGDIDK